MLASLDNIALPKWCLLSKSRSRPLFRRKQQLKMAQQLPLIMCSITFYCCDLFPVQHGRNFKVGRPPPATMLEFHYRRFSCRYWRCKRMFYGGESRDLNDRVHGISCRYSDKTSKQTYPAHFSEYPADFHKTKRTYLLIIRSKFHLKVTPQYAVVFHTSLNKYCFQYFDFARTFTLR